MQTVLNISVLFLAAVGLASCCLGISRWLAGGVEPAEGLLLIMVEKDDEYADMRLRRSMWELKNSPLRARVVVIDQGAGEQMAKACGLMCREWGVPFIPASQAGELLGL